MRKASGRRVARYILRKILEDVRWKVVLLFVALLFLDGIYRIGGFRAQYGVGVAPWIAPHMLSMLPVQFTLILGFLLITCGVPYLEDDAIPGIVRSGFRAWGRGVLLAVAAVAFLYTVSVFLLSILFMLPAADFEAGWGKALTSFSRNPGAFLGYFKIFHIDDRIVSSYSPTAAMLLSFLLEFLCLSALGLSMLVCNLATGRQVGVYAALVFAGLDFLVYNDLGDKAAFISPVSLARLSVLDPTGTSFYPTPAYGLCFLSGLCLLLCLAAMLLIRRLKQR